MSSPGEAITITRNGKKVAEFYAPRITAVEKLTGFLNEEGKAKKRKSADKDKAHDAMEIIRDVLTVCDVTGDSAEEAIDERSRDFEDELIAKTALKAGCDYILTRNVKDYAKSPVKAITPKELLKMFD